MQWFPVAALVSVTALHYLLWWRWTRFWARGRPRRERLRFGGVGTLAALVAFVTVVPAAAWLGRGPNQAIWAGVAFVPVAVGCTFFGNVLLWALLSRTRS